MFSSHEKLLKSRNDFLSASEDNVQNIDPRTEEMKNGPPNTMIERVADNSGKDSTKASSPTTTMTNRAFAHCVLLNKWCARADLNCRPIDYHTTIAFATFDFILYGLTNHYLNQSLWSGLSLDLEELLGLRLLLAISQFFLGPLRLVSTPSKFIVGKLFITSVAASGWRTIN